MSSLKNQQEVESLAEKFEAMKGLILTEYHGLKVEEIAKLRSKLRPIASEYTVVKNTLSKKAFEKIGIKADKNFSGPTAVVIANGDVISPARIVVEFAKTHTKLKIKAGFLDRKFVDASFIIKLSSLPSREVLITKILGSLSGATISFVSVLSANVRGLVTVLGAVVKKGYNDSTQMNKCG
jgi:large subunit ribosomal protein L10